VQSGGINAVAMATPGITFPLFLLDVEKNKIENWLKIRLNQANLKLIFQ
jgi:hypothetical protein